MAISPIATYPGGVSVDAAYPYGKARNVSSPDAGDGTPYEAAIVNDTQGFLQALLTTAGITPSGTPDSATASQYLSSVLALISGLTISPSALAAGNTSNYSPTGWSTAGLVRLTASGSATLLGLDSTASVTTKLLANVDATDTVTLRYLDGTQAANNRIATHTMRDIVLRPGDIVLAVLDVASTCWRIVGVTDRELALSSKTFPLASGQYTGSWELASDGSYSRNAAPGTSELLQRQIELPDGVACSNFRARAFQTNDATTDMVIELVSRDYATWTATVEASITFTGAFGPAYQLVTDAVSTFTVDNSANAYFVRVSACSADGVECGVYWASVDF